MEINFLNRKKGLELKIPEISKTLTVVEYLVSKQVNLNLILYFIIPFQVTLNIYSFFHYEDSDEPIETTFELNDTLWANATIKSTKTVNLWLGVTF